MKPIAIGVDIGGSHISCAACNMHEKTYLPHTFTERPVNNKDEADVLIRTWGDTLRIAMEAVGVEQVQGIGFAMPGPFEYDTGVSRITHANDKYEKLYGINVADSLRAYLQLPATFPIRFINDATAFALGENWIGKTQGTHSALSITLGTGFGSAFLIDGLPVVTGDTVPESGCLWHVAYEQGIADDYFSTRGFLSSYVALTGKQATGVREIAADAEVHPQVRALFEDFGARLGVFLLPWIEKAQVEVLVIGGNISNAFPLFKDTLQQVYVQKGYTLRIEVSELKETASIIGSSVLVDDDFYERVKPLLSLM